MTGTGGDYKGKQTKTRGGFTCRRWDDESVNPPDVNNNAKKKYNTENYPGVLVENYCRNPDPTDPAATGIWCYTTDASKRSDNCDPMKDPAAAANKDANKVKEDANNAADKKDDTGKKDDADINKDDT
jgi:hypothetical protein